MNVKLSQFVCQYKKIHYNSRNKITWERLQSKLFQGIESKDLGNAIWQKQKRYWQAQPLSCWTWSSAFANSVDPDQLASEKPTDLDLHCLPLSMWIYINNLDQVIWLAEN